MYADNVVYFRGRALIDQMEAHARLVRANSTYVCLARLHYEGGYSPYSTVLQADQQLLLSELNYAPSLAHTHCPVEYIMQWWRLDG